MVRDSAHLMAMSNQRAGKHCSIPVNGTPTCLLLSYNLYYLRYRLSSSAPRPQSNPSPHEFWRHFKIQIIATSYQAKICDKMDIGCGGLNRFGSNILISAKPTGRGRKKAAELPEKDTFQPVKMPANCTDLVG